MSIISKLAEFGGPLGIYQLARILTRHRPRILMYHRFSENDVPGCISRREFSAQLQYIKRYYNPITLVSLIQLLDAGKKVPSNTIVLTVDDGYRDFYEIAFPLLQQYAIPATVFVTTGFVDNTLWLWPDKISWLLDNVLVRDRDVHIGPVVMKAGKNQSGDWQSLVDFLLSIDDEQKHQWIDHLAAAWNLDLPILAPEKYAAVNWNQLKEMQGKGIEIGGHTVTHPSLGRVDKVRAIEEIDGSMGAINKNLGSRIRTFCYPNGQPNDYGEEIMSLVERAGFCAAVVAFADNGVTATRYSMRRHTCGESSLQFLKSISGLEWLGFKVRGVSYHE